MSSLLTSAVVLLVVIASTTAIWVLSLAPTQHGGDESDAPGADDTFSSKPTTSVQVVVLGDIGRSPRMQNHAISLAKHGARVHLVGFVDVSNKDCADSDVHPELQKSRLVTVVPLSPTPNALRSSSRLLFTLTAPLKVIWQIIDLFCALGYRSGPSRWMLIQNPPSIPTLAVAVLICRIRRSLLVIDWHNTGWSMLALKLGRKHPLVYVAEYYERLISRWASQHFAVSVAMRNWLRSELQIEALALHDRPTRHFKRLDAVQRAKILSKLPETAPYSAEILNGSWRLIVSSTSWTTDEDFSILLDALIGYSACVTSDESLPGLRVVITGKGAGKEHYLQQIRLLDQAQKLSNVFISTGWFSVDDYIALLGAADLGVSLHKSSSGYDLPMKVVDMFAAGLPVVGYCGYVSWPELVREGVNGRGFLNSQELEDLFVSLFSNHGHELLALREGAAEESAHGWDEEWDGAAGRQVFFTQNASAHK